MQQPGLLTSSIPDSLDALARSLQGNLYFNNTTAHLSVRKIYATDASMYQELPMAVLLPATETDIQLAIRFAAANGITLIPRAAGTSLAGQVVGNGIVVDISSRFTQILELNREESWVRVQPGVIRDDLNQWLKPHGLLYGPETSTANRAMIGGMIGNNSCGLHSLIWGAARDHLISLTGYLSNGEKVVLSRDQTIRPATNQPLSAFAQELEAAMLQLLQDPANRELIRAAFPDPAVKRRNSGYALDAVLDDLDNNHSLDLCKLIAGAEGTLFFITEAKLALIPLPPPHASVVALHCHSLRDALEANLIALEQHCAASELVDDYILGFARQSARFQEDAYFVEGHPKAILMVEFFGDSREAVLEKAQTLVQSFITASKGYAWPVLYGSDTQKAWEVRKAGLGLIRNLPGTAQPVNLIEDGAVPATILPDYMDAVDRILQRYGIRYCVYAHAGPGELHIEPILDLTTQNGQKLLRVLLSETAALIRQYKGALSGEHGDGRLRGEFIPFMMGAEVYELFRTVKKLFDPHGVFNRNKIVDTPPMDTQLRYEAGKLRHAIPTFFNYEEAGSVLHLTEKCSGSGDCRRSAASGGLMCPSYMATREEKDTTRARANILRQFITENNALTGKGETEVNQILDLCLSCKGCKTECPSAVDMTRLKAEFTAAQHRQSGIPFRTRVIAGFDHNMQLARKFRWIYNGMMRVSVLRRLLNQMIGFHPERTMPLLSRETLRDLYRKRVEQHTAADQIVYLFCDEFTNQLDASVGADALRFMQQLGYQVRLVEHPSSARSMLSKGLVAEAREIAEKQVSLFAPLINDNQPLVGIEPSAILGFRDEYPDLVAPELRAAAKQLAVNVFTFEEWVYREMQAGRIHSGQFRQSTIEVKVHEHCHQKALSKKGLTSRIIAQLTGTTVTEIPSGCCGMAGSFGYEKEHFELSNSIGELVLFPAIRNAAENTAIVAAGTSCRHQIKDGTRITALHPATLLYRALQ